jgi:predicted alpha/beta superfamily hydrolase
MPAAPLRVLALFLALLAAPAAAQPQPIVIGQTWRLPSQALGAERTINVWTPPGHAQGDHRYPVVYLIDGGLGQDFHHVTGLAQLGALSWLTRELIVVGVETDDRRRELAFPTDDAALRREFPTAGEAARFRRHLVDEVKPFVAAHYRTSGEAALLGESLAGLFILETYLREPAAFDTYIAMDPSLWWDGGSLSREAPALLARHGPEPRRLWLSIARETSEQPAHADRLLAALRAHRPLTLRYEPRPALTHATIYHPTAWEALQALYPRPGD